MIERIRQILRSRDLNLNGNVSEFARRIGMKQTTVNNCVGNVREDKHRPINLDLITHILDTFPQISAEWLLRGKGDMLLADDKKTQQAQNIGDLTPTLNYLSDRCRQLESQLANIQSEKGKMAV